MVGESRAEPQHRSDCLMEAMSDKAQEVSSSINSRFRPFYKSSKLPQLLSLTYCRYISWLVLVKAGDVRNKSHLVHTYPTDSSSLQRKENDDPDCNCPYNSRLHWKSSLVTVRPEYGCLLKGQETDMRKVTQSFSPWRWVFDENQ